MRPRGEANRGNSQDRGAVSWRHATGRDVAHDIGASGVLQYPARSARFVGRASLAAWRSSPDRAGLGLLAPSGPEQPRMIIYAVSLVLALVGFGGRFGIAELENGHLAPFID